MRTVALFALLFLSVQTAYGAISFDNTSASGGNANTTGYTWTHTCNSGSCTVVLAATSCSSNFSGNAVASFSVDSNSISTQQTINPGAGNSFCGTQISVPKTGLASGSHTLAVSLNTEAQSSYAVGTSYLGVNASTPVDASGTTATSASFTGAGSVSLNFTTTNNGAWVVDALSLIPFFGATGVSPSGSQQQRNAYSNGVGTSDLSVATAGSISDGWVFTNSGEYASSFAELVAYSLNPASSGVTCTITLTGAGPC